MEEETDEKRVGGRRRAAERRGGEGRGRESWCAGVGAKQRAPGTQPSLQHLVVSSGGQCRAILSLSWPALCHPWEQQKLGLRAPGDSSRAYRTQTPGQVHWPEASQMFCMRGGWWAMATVPFLGFLPFSYYSAFWGHLTRPFSEGGGQAAGPRGGVGRSSVEIGCWAQATAHPGNLSPPSTLGGPAGSVLGGCQAPSLCLTAWATVTWPLPPHVLVGPLLTHLGPCRAPGCFTSQAAFSSKEPEKPGVGQRERWALEGGS